MLESLNYSSRNPQKNIIWVIYRIKQLRNYKKNHGVLRGPQLGKQRWRVIQEEIKRRLLSLGGEYFIFQCAIQKYKDQDIQNYNFACCFVWVWNLVTHIEGEGVWE